MKIDIFSTEYLQFIFSNIFTFLGFLIILLILTNGLSKLIEPIKDFFTAVKKKYKTIEFRDKFAEKISKRGGKEIPE